jgi:hypothetical protein
MVPLKKASAPSAPIDLWDYSSFDDELRQVLEPNRQLIQDYFETDHAIFLSHDLGRSPSRSSIRPDNPHASAYYDLLDEVNELMRVRTIRAYHYTRLTDQEVEDLHRSGIHLSTPETLQHRLNALVASGQLLAADAEVLFTKSPFHSEQRQGRIGKFWMTSHPVSVDDGGVVPLMERWGGEVASFWLHDPQLISTLKEIGKARVIEIAAPLSKTRHSHSAATAAVAAFGRTAGAIPEKSDFDLYTNAPLEPGSVLAVHTEGDVTFAAIGKSYPPAFIDVDIGRWKELTGEDD